MSVTGMLLKIPPVSGFNISDLKTHEFHLENRMEGKDWPKYGLAMTGVRRLSSIETMLHAVTREQVAGDFVECGVWRGGSSIFAKAVMKAHNTGTRRIHLVDSFEGLPRASTAKDADHWSQMEFLKVSQAEVEENFRLYQLLDGRVLFHKGYFRDALPLLRQTFLSSGQEIAILRMDGDMYESTVDILYNLYDLVAVGGWVIVDDWAILEAQAAMKDFFERHKVSPVIEHPDNDSIYFQIKSSLVLDMDWYKKFNSERRTR